MHEPVPLHLQPACIPRGAEWLAAQPQSGSEAAALALCYQEYRTSDPTFANTCLLSAEHVFDLANTNWTGNLVTAIPFSF
jgi:hypothetical protein